MPFRGVGRILLFKLVWRTSVRSFTNQLKLFVRRRVDPEPDAVSEASPAGEPSHGDRLLRRLRRESDSTDATACPHCGKPKEADTKNGWISSYVKYFAVISGTLTLAGSVIWFLYQRNVEIETHKQEIVRNTELAINRAETLKLSEKAETRQSKRSVLDLQLKTYASVLNNIAQINAMVMTRKTDSFDK
jgi:hypothetical protein